MSDFGTTTVENVESSTLFETIDSSVFERMNSNSEYKPKNVLTWAEQNNYDWKTRITSVRAFPQLATNEELIDNWE